MCHARNSLSKVSVQKRVAGREGKERCHTTLKIKAKKREREEKKEGSREAFWSIVTERLSQDYPSGMAGIWQE